MNLRLPVPGPSEDFTVCALSPEDVGVWYHVLSTFGHPYTAADTFSEGWGSTRFAPIHELDGTPVHTYYVANSTDAAYMESVLHDVILPPPGVFEVNALRYYFLVTLRLPSTVQYVSFHTHDLPRLKNIPRAQLIDSAPVCYPQTRAWSQAAYRQNPGAQAIGYGSRRNDAGRCLMLFKQRMPQPAFEVLQVESLAIGARRIEFLALVRSLKLYEV